MVNVILTLCNELKVFLLFLCFELFKEHRDFLIFNSLVEFACESIFPDTLLGVCLFNYFLFFSKVMVCLILSLQGLIWINRIHKSTSSEFSNHLLSCAMMFLLIFFKSSFVLMVAFSSQFNFKYLHLFSFFLVRLARGLFCCLFKCLASLFIPLFKNPLLPAFASSRPSFF